MALKKCKECGHDISKKADKCINCGAPQKSAFGIFKVLGGTIKWGVALLFGLIVYNGYNAYQEVEGIQSDKKAEINKVLSNIELDFTWNKTGFDSVMEATFVVKNNSDRNIKDMTIECIHSAKSGTVIDRNKRTIYETFPAKTEKKIKNMNMGFIHGQAEKSSCRVTDAVILS